MKRWIFFVLAAFFCSPAYANTLTLDSSETVVDAPANTSSKLTWKMTVVKGVCSVDFQWFDASNRPIGRVERFECRDWKQEGGSDISNDDCTAEGEPYGCCTALDEGVCDCWSDVFLFQIRSQDVGTSIGVGLRQLLFQQWKKVYLTGTNNGTFD